MDSANFVKVKYFILLIIYNKIYILFNNLLKMMKKKMKIQEIKWIQLIFFEVNLILF